MTGQDSTAPETWDAAGKNPDFQTDNREVCNGNIWEVDNSLSYDDIFIVCLFSFES